jgi:hypothetical protein
MASGPPSWPARSTISSAVKRAATVRKNNRLSTLTRCAAVPIFYKNARTEKHSWRSLTRSGRPRP